MLKDQVNNIDLVFFLMLFKVKNYFTKSNISFDIIGIRWLIMIEVTA